MMLGYQTSYPETSCDFLFSFAFFFLSFNPTDPLSENAVDANRKKGVWPYCNPLLKLSISADSLEIIYLVLSGGFFSFNI